MNSVTIVRKLSRNRSPTENASPELAEALEDQARVANPRHRSQANDHLLVDDQHGISSSSTHSRLVP